MVRAEHGKSRALPSPEFSLNARIPTLPNCVQEGDFNLASTALQNCTTSFSVGRPPSYKLTGGSAFGWQASDFDDGEVALQSLTHELD